MHAGGGLSGLPAASHGHLRPRVGQPTVGQRLTGLRMARRRQQRLVPPLGALVRSLGAKRRPGQKMTWVGRLGLE
ncbi:hypothetical protein CJ030_MR5G018716 [Morella rubra]|uniref:Uncharacterized protein n=1 Tax=Morella rubra TaxID=262757 RepID=A0A6A1VJL6_9ROSI|nr:hypothetical protein CJ030_MR5G018716 [Morella rubra]